MDSTQLSFAVAATTLIILSICAVVIVLLILNNIRHIRHRAELAEADRLREQEVQRAEREAVQHTLRDIGRELHDNVAQLLTVAQMGVNNAMLGLGDDTRLVSARDALDLGVEEVRRLAHSLNSDLWQQRSLADAISMEAARIERVGRIRAHVLRQGDPPELDGDASTILFRVFQEIVNNALKHSGADTLTITLEAGPPFVLTIADNGRGFDAASTSSNGGLINIQRRCALIGFDARCMSTAGDGCTWTLTQLPSHGPARSPGG